jgi:hypothetical protein
MHFHGGQAGGGNGVSNGHAGVGECGWIDEQAAYLLSVYVNTINKMAFMVGLIKAKRHVECPGFVPQLLVDLRQGSDAINAGLTLAQKIQIRSMYHQNDGFEFKEHGRSLSRMV